MKVILLIMSFLILTGCRYTAKYRILPTGSTAEYYCDSYTIHDGVVEGTDTYGYHFTISGDYVVEEMNK